MPSYHIAFTNGASTRVEADLLMRADDHWSLVESKSGVSGQAVLTFPSANVLYIKVVR